MEKPHWRQLEGINFQKSSRIFGLMEMLTEFPTHILL